jgi:hypothetical protein
MESNNIQLACGPFTTVGHEYQLEPMQSTKQKRCVKKATQGGWTEIEVGRTLHGQIHGHLPLGTLYLFPTDVIVSDFSSSRFDPLIRDNPCIGEHVTATDRVGLKRVGKGYLYLRGARLSQKIGGLEKHGAQLTSIPVDKVVFDERDFMDDLAIDKALSRMGHSLVKEEVYLGNPTIPGFGIDKLYQDSDQRHWMIKCRKCHKETCLEEEFPACVKINKEGRAYRACVHCAAEIYQHEGEWVPKHPGREMAGWWWSQLNSMYVDPGDILKAFNNPPRGNISDVYRLMLGRAHIAEEERLTLANVYNCCDNNQAMLTGSRGPCAMGVDVGLKLYVVIGQRLNMKQHRLIKTARVSEWNDVHDLAKKFGVRNAVIDWKPEIHKSREFQKNKRYEVFLCDYSETLGIGKKWDLKTGMVKVNRTEIMDETHSLVTTPGELALPRLCSEMRLYAEEMCNTAKIQETDEVTGAQVYRYRKLGDDHYRHATNYYKLAADRVRRTGGGFPKRQQKAETDFE